MNRIPAQALATKLKAVRELEYPDLAKQLQEQPRLLEALWFVQAISMRPGGLPLFCESLIKASDKRFCEVITSPLAGFDEFGEAHYRERVKHSAERCMDRARSDLPQFLYDLCVVKHVAFRAPWYFRELFNALFDAMDAHKTEVLSQIATTETTRKAFHWLEFSLQSKTPVPIVGASRFGKTTAVQTWCESRPGLARIVTVPQSNTERDLIVAIADAFGIDYAPSNEAYRIRDQVQHVLQHSGLFMVFDEAHFLVPITYWKSTAPRRLNWVRCQIIDKGVGCAFFATPQSYKQTLDRFAKETGYAMEQWLGRMAPPVTLPEELDFEDLLAVAKLRFPGIKAPQLEVICSAAMASEGYLKNIELFAKYAQFLASQRGAPEAGAEDIKAAIQQFIPSAVKKPFAEPVQRARSRSAQPVQTPENRVRFDRTMEAVTA
ncbi:MAG: AAA family ATPase [Verrucomicrobiia bacterium]